MRSYSGRRLSLLLLSACAVLSLFAASARADLSFQYTFGSSGSGAGQFEEPAGVAVNGSTGDVYIADRRNNRIQQFTEQGDFIRAWGYDVVASGEDDKPFADEVQQVTVPGTSGLFRLTFDGTPSTSPFSSHDESTTGGDGFGDITSGSPTITNLKTVSSRTSLFAGSTQTNFVEPGDGWEVGMPISGPGIPPGTTVTGVYSGFNSDLPDALVLEMSAPVTASGNDITISSSGPAPFGVGQTIVGPGIPAGTTIESVGPGTLTLSNAATATQAGAGITSGIPHDANASEVQAILNALPSVTSGGGSVTVTGGPGGTNPYTVTASGGSLAGGNIDEMRLQTANLGRPIGTELSCLGVSDDAEEVGGSSSISYQWLANGEPISGATSPTYTLAAGDAGKVIQCRVGALFQVPNPDATIYRTNNVHTIAGDVPSTLPPVGQSLIQQPSQSGTIAVGSNGGQTLTCRAGNWSGNPTSYTYQWYASGDPMRAPITTASTTNEITLTQGEVSEAEGFQCSVTATNAGGSSTLFSQIRFTSPPLAGAGLTFVEYPTLKVQDASGVAQVITTTNGGPVFEVCNANPPSDDVCKAGVAGPSLGQLDRPRSIAVDNSPGGGGVVYVGDDWNFRLQKFTATGDPLLTIGKDVNKSTSGNLCTAASGDACGSAVAIGDDERGVFGGWMSPAEEFGGDQEFSELGNQVAVDPQGNVLVGDPYRAETPTQAGIDFFPRIQKLDPSLNYIGQVFPPSKFGSPHRPLAVAANAEGGAVASFVGEERAVVIFKAAEFTPEGTQAELATANLIHNDFDAPKQVAVDPVDDKIWITDKNQNAFVDGSDPDDICGEGGPRRIAILAYDDEGHRLECDEPNGLGFMPRVSGIAISPSGLLFASIQTQGKIKVFKVPQETAPLISSQRVDKITTETAELHGLVNPGFDATTYRFEYGTAPCSSSPCTSVPGSTVYGLKFVPVESSITGLAPGTRYYYRLVAENGIGETAGPDRTFRTFPFVDLVNDKCPNALARKQTRTAGTFDCRAYELASADFTGGYDVVSDLTAGQVPYEGYPEAEGRLLYAVRDGGIPGTGSPTNRGPDPYVATRGNDGVWTTRYVGIPADGGFSTNPFSSTLADASAGLTTFAFSGPEICKPCFPDGSAGVPLRLPSGELVQGMAGSLKPAAPEPAGYVADHLSADGVHFVFGSTSQFEPEGNSNGDVTIYDRNLAGGSTQVVSTDDNGDTLEGPGIAELDVSEDGERVIVGQKAVPDDPAGNSHWQLYMHVGENPQSVDLTPGTTSGVLYGGMSGDGSRVFFSTEDQLLGEDGDASADVYEAAVDGDGNLDLRLVSVTGGGPSNDDSCSPSGEPNSWNAISGDGDCNALVLAGGAGVASGDGTAYFLSPELLDGPDAGTADEPNLYVVRPGADPRFVATLDSTSAHPAKSPPEHPAVTSSLVTGLTTPESVTVDQSNGDLYVVTRSNNTVNRFDSTGAAKNFTAGPGTGTNKISGLTLGVAGRNQIAVDNASAGVLQNAFYVRKSATVLGVYAQTGEELGTLTGFNEVCGVAVDQSTGVLYVGDAGYPGVRRFAPTSPTAPISNADYTETSLKTDPDLILPCQLGVDTQGHVYANNRGTGNPLVAFEAAEFGAGGPLREGTELKIPGSIPPSTTVTVDPANDDVYVNTGSKIVLLDDGLNVVKVFGEGEFFNSRGVAVNESTKHVYVPFGSNIIEFGIEELPFEPIDHPAVVHAVDDNEVHRWSDFQTSPDDFALFSTKVPQIEGYDTNGKNMVYRYDAATGEIACASCLVTEGAPTTDAALPGHGLGITDDGRVFFNSSDQLVMRDTNGKLDAYEWREPNPDNPTEPNVALISTGFSAFPSSLLTVTRNGADAFFFTRETLVARDVNGQAMKIYDAREDGGFFVIPQSPPCAASDECHGPSSQAASPPPIGTFKGIGGNHKRRLGCKKGFVKKRGKCVKRKRHKKRGAHRKRGARTPQGGRR